MWSTSLLTVVKTPLWSLKSALSPTTSPKRVETSLKAKLVTTSPTSIEVPCRPAWKNLLNRATETSKMRQFSAFKRLKTSNIQSRVPSTSLWTIFSKFLFRENKRIPRSIITCNAKRLLITLKNQREISALSASLPRACLWPKSMLLRSSTTSERAAEHLTVHFHQRARWLSHKVHLLEANLREKRNLQEGLQEKWIWARQRCPSLKTINQARLSTNGLKIRDKTSRRPTCVHSSSWKMATSSKSLILRQSKTAV